MQRLTRIRLPIAPGLAAMLCAVLGCSSTIPTRVSDYDLGIYSKRMDRVQVGMSEKAFVKIWSSPYMPEEPFKIGLLESIVTDSEREGRDYTIGYWNYADGERSQYKKQTKLVHVRCLGGRVEAIQHFDGDGELLPDT